MPLNTQTEKLFQIEAVTLDKGIFDQIAAPRMSHLDGEHAVAIAKDHAIALAIDQDEDAWIIIQEANHLWRWNAFPAEHLLYAIKEYPWIGKLPQVFLVKRKRKEQP